MVRVARDTAVTSRPVSVWQYNNDKGVIMGIILAKRGYTPILAVTLLMVMSIGLFFIVAVWSKSYSQREIKTHGSYIDKQIRCSEAGLRIRKYSIDSDTNTINVYIRNVGQIDLKNVVIYITDSEGDIYNTNISVGVPADRQDYLVQINLSEGIIPASIRATSECPSAQDMIKIE